MGVPQLILLVDDVPGNLHVLAEALRNDYRIKLASDGQSALDLASRPDRPDLILLDVMMPGMSGHEVLRRLRDRPETRDIPVIFVSADSSQESELAGLALGADDYLTKPVVVPVLLARVRNLLARTEAQTQLQLAAQVFQNTSEGIVITDAEAVILDVNPAYCEIMGYSRAEMIGSTPSKVRSDRHDEAFYSNMWEALRTTGRWVGEVWDRRKGGDVFPKWLSINTVRNGAGLLTHYIGIFSDISPLKAAEEKLERMAYYDALTGLPNRVMFRDRLEQEISICRRYGQRAAVLFIDLDRFKYVNDTLGHAAGDELLIEIAGRLSRARRANDTIARLGGDEFTLILRDIRDAEAAARVATDIIERLGAPVTVAGEEVFVGASIGISLLPEDGMEVDLLTRRADAAMYQAKEGGRGQFRFYTAATDQRTRDHLALDKDLRRALERNEFVLHYQPQADVASGALVGAEALIRWRHPTRGLVPPNAFIPIAEESGLILALGDWVLQEVCRQLADWRAAGMVPPPIAVNLSPRQFRQEDLAERTRDILARQAIPPSLIELEITESTAMEKADSTVDLLNRLHASGFRIAIDDFGTGYSSLAYLKRFPVDKLKIDRSFIMDIPDDSNDTAIASAIIQMGKSLGLVVVAEGVETEEQRQFLLTHGGQLLQGYLYGRPMDAERFGRLIAEGMMQAG